MPVLPWRAGTVILQALPVASVNGRSDFEEKVLSMETKKVECVGTELFAVLEILAQEGWTATGLEVCGVCEYTVSAFRRTQSNLG
jgi:hypothetical protein